MPLDGIMLNEFAQAYADGMQANELQGWDRARVNLSRAATIARAHSDVTRESQAVVPLAKALCSAGHYDVADIELFETLQRVKTEPNLVDEHGAILTGLGRCAAVRVARVEPYAKRVTSWRKHAVPYFAEAAETLDGHPHLYYRYANDTHGAVVGALARERGLARELIRDAERIRHWPSPPYDDRTPHEISPAGERRLRAAKLLLPLGYATPFLGDKVRLHLS